jgi:hypothetical protein
MRPTRLVLFLAALLLLAPVSALAGKGGGGGGTGVVLDDPVEGDYFFLDKVSADKIKSIASLDQKAGEFCVNGLANYLDTSVTLNRRVEIFFSSTGSIEKQGPGKVDGLFTTSALTINVYAGPTLLFPIIFTATLDPAPCEFDAKLSKIGLDQGNDPGVDDDELIGHIKADLVCDLSAFIAGVLGQKGGDVIVDSLAFALDKKKSIKLRVQTGDFRINHNGFRVDPVAEDLDFSRLTACTAPPPPPPE